MTECNDDLLTGIPNGLDVGCKILLNGRELSNSEEAKEIIVESSVNKVIDLTDDYIVLEGSTLALLPPLSEAYKTVTVYSKDSTVTVGGNGTDTVDGNPARFITPQRYVRFIPTESEWVTSTVDVLGGTDLSSVATASNVSLISSTGTSALLSTATSSLSGIVTSADKVNLDSNTAAIPIIESDIIDLKSSQRKIITIPSSYWADPANRVNISSPPLYTITKAEADGFDEIWVLAGPTPDQDTDTDAIVYCEITTETSIVSTPRYLSLNVIHDGTGSLVPIQFAVNSFSHGVTPIELPTNGDHLQIDKTNNATGNFWTVKGGRCKSLAATEEEKTLLYATTVYWEAGGLTVEEALKRAVVGGRIPRLVEDFNVPHGVTLSEEQSNALIQSTLGLNCSFVGSPRVYPISGTTSGFGIFGGDGTSPTNGGDALMEFIIPADQYTSGTELSITRASASNSGTRRVWVYDGDPGASGTELVPLSGDVTNESTTTATSVIYSLDTSGDAVPTNDIHVYSSRQYIRDIDLYNAGINGRISLLENSRNIIFSDSASVACTSNAEVVATAETQSGSENMVLAMKEGQFGYASEAGVLSTVTSQSLDMSFYAGSGNVFASLDNIPQDLTSFVQPDPFNPVTVNITGLSLTRTGDPGGNANNDSSCWGQSGQIAGNFMQFTVGGLKPGAVVSFYWTVATGNGTVPAGVDININPVSGFVQSTEVSVPLTSGSFTEYQQDFTSSVLGEAVIRIRGGNVTPYRLCRVEVLQTFTSDFTYKPNVAHDYRSMDSQADYIHDRKPELEDTSAYADDSVYLDSDAFYRKVRTIGGTQIDEHIGYTGGIIPLTLQAGVHWYRVATSQATAKFVRDFRVYTQDGSHSSSGYFAVGARARVNDGAGSDQSKSMVPQMYFKRTGSFAYQIDTVADDPIRAIRYVQEGASTGNHIIHVDISLFQDAGTSNGVIEYNPNTVGDLDSLRFNAVPAVDPDITGFVVDEYVVQGLTEREGNAYAVSHDRATGLQSFISSSLPLYTGDPITALGTNTGRTQILEGCSLVTQSPVAVDTLLQVEFGAVQLTPQVELAANGDITFLEPGTYFVELDLGISRAGTAGMSDLFVGTQVSTGGNPAVWTTKSDFLRLDSSDTVMSYNRSTMFDIPRETVMPVVVSYYFWRDSSGNNSGELSPKVPTLVGAPISPSSCISISTMG
jgi:hypothetical protein